MIDHVKRIRAGNIEIAYEAFGRSGLPVVLLVMGFATQMIGWPDEFCRRLAERGHRVVRFDNRDVGLSTHLSDVPPPDLGAILSGETSRAPYRLSDMAADSVGLLDALGVEHVHLVGASMGGMVAQTVAIEHPARVRSLTSIMSTTGDPSVGQPSPAAMASLFAPAATTRAEAIERNVAAWRVIRSRGYGFDEAGVRERAAQAFDRAFDPGGATRQLAAVLASGDRSGRLQEVTAPTLVVHGAQDLMIDVSGGRATAAAVPDAELLVIEGMGHDLPRELWGTFVDRIGTLAARAEADRQVG